MIRNYKMKEGQGISYRYNIDKDKAYLYADKKCKHCNGKGYFVTQLPATQVKVRHLYQSSGQFVQLACNVSKLTP